MLCDRCKMREAKIYYTEIVNGKKKEQHLCEQCAAQCSSMKMQVPLENFLSTILGIHDQDENVQPEEEKGPVCKFCNMTYQDFLKAGKFGCANCYEAFRPFLNKNMRRIQGADYHRGKRPADFMEKEEKTELSEVERLKEQLKQAVQEEEFEEAARLRDLIRQKKEETQEKENKRTEQMEATEDV